MTPSEAPSISSQLASREPPVGMLRDDAPQCAEDAKDYPPNARPERADTTAEPTFEKGAEARAVSVSEPPESAPALRSRDFYILPIPKSRRYDPEKPVPFSPFLNYLFAFVGRISRPRSPASADSLRIVGLDFHGGESVLLPAAADPVLRIFRHFVNTAPCVGEDVALVLTLPRRLADMKKQRTSRRYCRAAMPADSSSSRRSVT